MGRRARCGRLALNWAQQSPTLIALEASFAIKLEFDLNAVWHHGSLDPAPYAA
jgi:hypothetical protein